MKKKNQQTRSYGVSSFLVYQFEYSLNEEKTFIVVVLKQKRDASF